MEHHGRETRYIIYSLRTISRIGATSRRSNNGIVGDWACGCDSISRPATKRTGGIPSGIKKYSYLESSTPVPIAVWVFDFPKPHGQIDSTLNARFVEKDLTDEYLDSGMDGVKHALYFFLLDGKILQGMKMVALYPEAVELFHGTIKKQLKMDYDRADYEICLGGFPMSRSMP